MVRRLLCPVRTLGTADRARRLAPFAAPQDGDREDPGITNGPGGERSLFRRGSDRRRLEGGSTSVRF